MNGKTWAQGMFRVLAVLSLAAMLAGMRPGLTSAARSEESFESPTYGFSVTWDSSIWSGGDSSQPKDKLESVTLGTDNTYAYIVGVNRPSIDAEACVSYMAEGWQEDDGVSAFQHASRSYEVPENPVAQESGLYTMTLETSDGAQSDLVIYLSCDSIQNGDAALMITLTSTVEAYAQELPLWNDLLASIDLAGGSNTGSADIEDETNSDVTESGAVYDDPSGFSVSYDTAIWTAEPWDDDQGTGIQIESDTGFGYFRPVDASDDLAICPEDMAYKLEQSSGLKNVRRASSSYERPVMSLNGVGELYTVIDAKSASKFIVFAGCAQIDDDYDVAVLFFADVSSYDDVLPQWQQVIDTLQVGGGESESSTTIEFPGDHNLGKTE